MRLVPMLQSPLINSPSPPAGHNSQSNPAPRLLHANTYLQHKCGTQGVTRVAARRAAAATARLSLLLSVPGTTSHTSPSLELPERRVRLSSSDYVVQCEMIESPPGSPADRDKNTGAAVRGRGSWACTTRVTGMLPLPYMLRSYASLSSLWFSGIVGVGPTPRSADCGAGSAPGMMFGERMNPDS